MAPRPAHLRLLTCGSVDDGKSTLIGRLLFEENALLEDQLAAVTRDSAKFGTTGAQVDLALVMDGLEAEREQGITIDVAYRFFSSGMRDFIIADAPGHEQYTRNMATAASVSDLALLLVDARKGLLQQTRRHAIIASLFGIRHVVLAVNKMDLVGFEEKIFAEISKQFAEFSKDLGFATVAAVPICARAGDNVVRPGGNMNWYTGPALLGYLETIDAGQPGAMAAFRMPVQMVSRPHADFRGFAGTIVGGTIAKGDKVVVAASGASSSVARIVTMDGDLAQAGPGRSVTVTLADEIDVSRGDVLAPIDAAPQVADQFAVKLLWFGDAPMLSGRPYAMKIGTARVQATITTLKHRIDVNTLGHQACRTLERNEIGICNIALSAPVAFDPYAQNRETGGFILIDRTNGATVAAGMIDFALRRSANVHWQALDVDKGARAALLRQRPVVLWFTGLSGSGKSTIANLVEKRLHDLGRHTYLLDGDNVRHGLARDLGFTDADRVENIRRVGEVARLFTDAGLIVMVSFISPFTAERRLARAMVGPEEFIEVFVDTPIEVCQARDPKGLYARALAGDLANFTGISSPYEPPENPEIHIDTTVLSAEDAAERVVADLVARGFIS
ncbi:MAG: adenylyl-sulfate kinase [Alphaproteobacteria bacterium]